MTKTITLSQKIPDDPFYSFWTYKEMYLVNKATDEVLTQTDEGLQLLPKVTTQPDPTQQWILDYNSENFPKYVLVTEL